MFTQAVNEEDMERELPVITQNSSTQMGAVPGNEEPKGDFALLAWERELLNRKLEHPWNEYKAALTANLGRMSQSDISQRYRHFAAALKRHREALTQVLNDRSTSRTPERGAGNSAKETSPAILWTPPVQGGPPTPRVPAAPALTGGIPLMPTFTPAPAVANAAAGSVLANPSAHRVAPSASSGNATVLTFKWQIVPAGASYPDDTKFIVCPLTQKVLARKRMPPMPWYHWTQEASEKSLDEQVEEMKTAWLFWKTQIARLLNVSGSSGWQDSEPCRVER